MTPFISIEQNKELFNEIKSKIKVNLKKKTDENDSEISIIPNNHLLRENPLEESSIYIKPSDIKQNELIRNVNIHIVPSKTNEVIDLKIIQNKMLNNSNNSNTIIQLEDEDYSFSKLISISDSNNNGHTSSYFNSSNKKENYEKDKKKLVLLNVKKTDMNHNLNKCSKKKFENIYKN